MGTESTVLKIKNFRAGNLPFVGGLAHHLTQGSSEGVAVILFGSDECVCLTKTKQMARYLAISEKELNAYDMHWLGLLTHIVEMEPHISIIHALGHTFAHK